MEANKIIKVAVFFSLVLFLSGFIVSSNVEASSGFKSGDEYTAFTVSGRVTVHCEDYNNQRRTAFFSCFDQILSPTSYSKFQTDSGVRAKRVHLRSTRSDGSIAVKDKKFKSSKGQSKRAFTLWAPGMRGLLGMGQNVLDYRLTDDDNRVVEEGAFTVNVENGGDRQCRWGVHYSRNMNDCTFRGWACRRYFQSQNYCR
jgi:hypothetical protein